MLVLIISLAVGMVAVVISTAFMIKKYNKTLYTKLGEAKKLSDEFIALLDSKGSRSPEVKEFQRLHKDNTNLADFMTSAVAIKKCYEGYKPRS